MLELVVNQRERGEIVPVERRDGEFWLRSGDLQRAGIPAAKLADEQVAPGQLGEVKVEYDERRQRLLLTVPPSRKTARATPARPATARCSTTTSTLRAPTTPVRASPAGTSYACSARPASSPATVSIFSSLRATPAASSRVIFATTPGTATRTRTPR